MIKSFSCLFLLFILSCGFISFISKNFCAVQASTDFIGIPKPSVPEFTVKFIEQKDNSTIEIIIKNQPFTPYCVGNESNSTISSHYLSLYYNVRTKGHFEYNWTEQIPSWLQPPEQSNLEYTVLSFPLLVQFPFDFNVAGGQIDFQVEAIIGNVTNVWDIIPEQSRSNQPLRYSERIWTIEQTSGWSNTQTLTLPEDYIPPTYPPPLTPIIIYTKDGISLNFTRAHEEASWMGYSLDGQDNVTITENILTLNELAEAEGSHKITVYATDNDGNTAASSTIRFTIPKKSELEQPDQINLTLAVALICLAIATGLGLLIYLKKRK